MWSCAIAELRTRYADGCLNSNRFLSFHTLNSGCSLPRKRTRSSRPSGAVELSATIDAGGSTTSARYGTAIRGPNTTTTQGTWQRCTGGADNFGSGRIISRVRPNCGRRLILSDKIFGRDSMTTRPRASSGPLGCMSTRQELRQDDPGQGPLQVVADQIGSPTSDCRPG